LQKSDNHEEVPSLPTPTLEAALLELLGRQAKRVPIPVFLAAVFIGAASYDVMGAVVVSLWLSIVALVLLLRYFVMGRLANDTGIPTRSRLRIAALLSATNGCVHAFPLVFFSALPDFERSIITIVMLGWCTGAVVTTAGYRTIFIAYLSPTLVPLISLWLLNWPDGLAWREGSFALLLTLFGGTLLVLAHDTFRLFRESFEIRLEQIGLNQKLRRALEDSELANIAKTRFLAAASHDLRQPIHSLNLFIGALNRRALDSKSQEIVDHLVLAVNTFDTQLDALLDVSKLDAGVVEVRSESIALYALIQRLVRQFSHLANEKGLDLSAECLVDAYGYSDKQHLERVLGNLLSNAIKYTELGQVKISIREHNGRQLISVSDTGRGIPREEQGRIFEEFYQLENPSRDRSKGLGLGLSIAKRLSNLLQLNLSLNSKVGRGTVFSIAVPCSAAPPKTQYEEQPVLSIRGLSILAVDDEVEVITSLKYSLESQGCVVHTAQDTATALDIAKVAQPDLLICDFRLSGNDNGICTVNAIRKLYPDLPAIMITGDTAPDRLREATAADLELMHKPVSDDELTKAIFRNCIN